MADLGWLALVGLAAWNLGDAALVRLRVAQASTKGANALVVGLALLSYLCLALGGLEMLRPWLLRALIIGLAIWGLLRARSGIRLPRQRPLCPRPLAAALAALLATGVLLSLLAALDPPTPLDLTHYHLRGPIFWLEHGRVAWPFRDLPYHYPQGMEILFALGLAVGSTRMPQLLHFLAALATLWGVMSFAQARWGRKVALLAGLFYWTVPEVYYLATIPFVDLAWTGAEVLAVLAFAEGLKISAPRDRLRQWALVGALAGWAAAVKYAALWTVLLLGIGVAWTEAARCAGRGEWMRHVLPAIAAYAAPTLAFAAFWYGKNWLCFGNPVYPFLWGGRDLAFEDAQRWTEFLRLFGPSRTIWRFLRLPWDIFMTQRIPSMQPGIFPYPIALVPLLVAYRRWERTAATLFLAFSLAYLTAWYWTGTQQLRFVLTPMALACLLAARGGGAILCRKGFLVTVAGGLLVAALLLSLVLQWQALAGHILPGALPQGTPILELWRGW